MAERTLGKGEVGSSILPCGTSVPGLAITLDMQPANLLAPVPTVSFLSVAPSPYESIVTEDFLYFSTLATISHVTDMKNKACFGVLDHKGVRGNTFLDEL